MWQILQYLLSQLVEIIFPKYCLGCSKFGSLLCQNCFEVLPFLQFPITQTQDSKIQSITIGFEYSKIIKNCIYEYKYTGIKMIGTLIAQLLYYSCNIPSCDYLTYVPLHSSKQKKRGFNQSEEIAVQLGSLLKKPVITLLEKNKPGISQMSIRDKNKRQKNLQGTLIFSPEFSKTDTSLLANKTILIVDDIYTTGSTLECCAQLITRHTPATICAICFAHKS